MNITDRQKLNLQRLLTKMDNGCLEFGGTKLRKGYGIFVIGSRKDGTRDHVLAHRAAYQIANGKIPNGMVVCHSCDNPSCCNPKHLFLGTHQDNSDDMLKKGRHIAGILRGAENPNAKFSEEIVLEVASGKVSCSQAQDKYGMSKSHFYRLRNNEAWKHITAERLTL